jgi:uncharacterized protein
VVDLAADPIAYYQAMLACRPPMIYLLLPHGTWDTLPPGLDPNGRETPYGDWLVAVFDHWYDAPRRETGIRFFEAVISLILGGDTACESLGTGQVDLLTVETDGSIEQVDSLKVAAEGAPATGLHVARDSFDAALRHPGIAARQRGLDALSDTCRTCPIVTICGGGLYTHRYRALNGFENPSVYCRDLYRVITHAVDRVRHDLERLPRSVGPASVGPASVGPASVGPASVGPARTAAGSDDQRLLDVTVEPLPVADHQAVGMPLAENTDDLTQDLCP